MARLKKRIELKKYTINPEQAERIYVRPNFGKFIQQKGRTNVRRYFSGDGNVKLSQIANIIKDTECTIPQNKINQIVDIIEK